MLTTLSSIASMQSAPTAQTMSNNKLFLDYAATHQDAVITYQASDMVLVVHSNAGVVHTNVGHQATPITSSKGYFCTKFYIRWSPDVTSPSTTTQTSNKQCHHGGGASRLSIGVDLMNPSHLRGGQPCACLLQGRRQGVLIEYISFNLLYFNIIACPPRTMVTKTMSIVIGGGQ
jgi:hypothetical protein